MNSDFKLQDIQLYECRKKLCAEISNKSSFRAKNKSDGCVCVYILSSSFTITKCMNVGRGEGLARDK